MRNWLYVAVVAVSLALPSLALARNLIEVVPPDYSGSTAELTQYSAAMVDGLARGDRLIIYTARPFAQIATIAIPDVPNATNRAWVRRHLAMQFAPVLQQIARLPRAVAGEPGGNVMIPALLDEIGRNVIPNLPDKQADILVVGTLLYFDPHDARWSMGNNRRYPSDGYLRVRTTESPFGTSGAETRLSGATVHLCWPDSRKDYATVEYEQMVRRFWTLWTVAQGGKIGTISDDVKTCVDRFVSGKSDGQTAFTPSAKSKPEMLQAPPPKHAAGGGTPDFLSEDAIISHDAPTTTKGPLWVGIKWLANCDLDIYARADNRSDWLFYGRVQNDTGSFSRDYQHGTGDAQYEFVSFDKPVELSKVELGVNLYEADLRVPPEGIVRVRFDDRVYEAPFKLAAKAGNRGADPMAPPYWQRIDIRNVVGAIDPAPAQTATR